MLDLIRLTLVLSFLLSSAAIWASDEKNPSFEYNVVRAHELEPHRRTIPHQGVIPGFNQLRLTLIVSPAGDVIDADAEADGDDKILKFWPELKEEVLQWKFIPFEKNGAPVAAEIEEYLDLVPPERLPKHHLHAPVLQPNSKIAITLTRSGCFGSCPAYAVTVNNDGVAFEGRSYVVVAGKHMGKVDVGGLQKLAKKFIAVDFYSMEGSYVASVTDNPTYTLSITIDGNTKNVQDYVGEWEGMPAVITELEDEVDVLARTHQWIAGEDGLVHALQAENFNFKTYEAQLILKEAANRGNAETVRQLLQAGVPLKPIPAPNSKGPDMGYRFRDVGLLYAASGDMQSLEALIEAGASKNDQADKDLALTGAASSGNVDAVRALIAYGANPNADLGQLTTTENGGGMTIQGKGAGSVLIYAAESGNPEMVREILSYHPSLEMKDQSGKTAMFAAGDYRSSDKDGARVECVRLLAHAGANVNARDKGGNTPLHEIYLTDVEAELLKLGADVNARNNDSETPIFTTVDDNAIALFIEHGADLTIRNKEGKTVVEAAREKGRAGKKLSARRFRN